MGHSRSLEMVPFDRSPTSSYLHSVVAMALSCIISEIKQDIGNLSFFSYHTCIRCSRRYGVV